MLLYLNRGRYFGLERAYYESIEKTIRRIAMSYECQIVVDFEFNPTKREYREYLKNEIIEIGAVKLNENLEEIGRFSCFVRPEFNDHIDSDILRLTGIRDADVREAACFEEAINLFAAWAGPAKCRVLSWSDSDLIQLEDECWAKEVPFPANLTRWMDLQLVWQRIINYPVKYRMSLSQAASICSIPCDRSKAHRAYYDAEVTAEILRKLKSREYMAGVAEAKSKVTTKVEHSTFSIASVYGDKLRGLMAQLAG